MGCRECGESENTRKHEGCLCEVLRFIKRVQDIGSDDDCVECSTDCFMAPLGSLVSPSKKQVNTRVFMLLTEDGSPFKAMFKPESRFRRQAQGAGESSQKHKRQNCLSVFFRVQNVSKDCCATIQVLEPQYRNGQPVDLFDSCGKLDFDKLCEVDRFGPTDSCITIDLKCFCGIQCIDDVYIDFCED